MKAPPQLVQLGPGLGPFRGWLWTDPPLDPRFDPDLDPDRDPGLEGGSGTGLGSVSRHQQHHISALAQELTLGFETKQPKTEPLQRHREAMGSREAEPGQSGPKLGRESG